MVIVEQWKQIQHSNIVAIREVFTTKQFNDHSVVFVYDFFPNAITLAAKHLQSHQVGGGSSPPPEPVSEVLLWSYIIQISSAIRAVHAAGLACRVIDASKVILTGRSRLRLNCVGIADMVTFDATRAPATSSSLTQRWQQEDLISFGKLILSLCCRSPNVAASRESVQQSLAFLSRNYSHDVYSVVMFLLTPQQQPTVSQPRPRTKSVHDLMPLIGARFFMEIECGSMYVFYILN